MAGIGFEVETSTNTSDQVRWCLRVPPSAFNEPAIWDFFVLTGWLASLPFTIEELRACGFHFCYEPPEPLTRPGRPPKYLVRGDRDYARRLRATHKAWHRARYMREYRDAPCQKTERPGSIGTHL